MKKAKSFVDALSELEERQSRSKRSLARAAALPASAIRTAPSVFQPRQFFGGDVDKYHVKELKRSLLVGTTGMLSPILVMQIGSRPYCIDGHHRLAAYKDANITSPIPVEWFEGTISEAAREAVVCNAQDKLPMSRIAKLEAAWRMVVLRLYSKAEISNATTIPASTIGTMRKKYKELEAARVGDNWANEFSDSGEVGGPYRCHLTWAEAKAHAKDQADKNGEWEEKIVNEWAQKLYDAFGKKWGQQPQLAARAIERYSERVPMKLVEAWTEDGVIEAPELEEER